MGSGRQRGERETCRWRAPHVREQRHSQMSCQKVNVGVRVPFLLMTGRAPEMFLCRTLTWESRSASLRGRGTLKTRCVTNVCVCVCGHGFHRVLNPKRLITTILLNNVENPRHHALDRRKNNFIKDINSLDEIRDHSDLSIRKAPASVARLVGRHPIH